MLHRIVHSLKEAMSALIEADIPFDGKTAYALSVKPYRKPRSRNQNSLYWMWLSVLEKESGSGHTREDFHDYFKWKYLALEDIVICGESMTRTPSTVHLNTLEMTEYLNKIHLFAHDTLNCHLPYPEDAAYEAMVNQYGR